VAIDTTGFAFPKPIHAEGREKLSKHKWRKRSAEVLAANDNKCSVEGCHIPATGTDHKRKRSLGRDDSKRNLQPLCYLHHSEKDGGQKLVISKPKWTVKSNGRSGQ
jgi:hypothetical protein